MARSMDSHKTPRLLLIACSVVLIAGLHFAQEVMVPLALAVLFSFLLAPLADRLERFKLPRVAAVLIVVVLTFCLLGVLGLIVERQLTQVVDQLPAIRDEIAAKVATVEHHFSPMRKAVAGLQDAVQQQSTTQPAATAPRITASTSSVSSEIISTVSPILSIAATAFVIIVLVIFMLLSRDDMRDRVIRLSGQGRLNITTQAMRDASERVSTYLLMQAIINGSVGAAAAIGLSFLHVEGAILWGLLCALLRFIPYAGIWLGAALPMTLALAHPGMSHFLMTVGLFVVIEAIASSVLEPYLYGTRTGVSSVGVLASAVFWAWLWGPVGLLLATPLTVCLVVLGKYVPHLELFNILLGDEPVFEPHIRYYQRLLASDQEEASDLIEEFLKQMSLEQLYENVLLPALSMAEASRTRGRIDEHRLEYIRQTMTEQVEELSDLPVAQSAATAPTATATTSPSAEAAAPTIPPQRVVTGASKVSVLCLPARDEADELSGRMFAQVLQRAGFKAEASSVTPLASEMIQMVENKAADIVVLCALPPAAVTHARYLCKRLHARFPELNVVVGLWTLKGDIKRAHERISCVKTDSVASTFSEAIDEIEQLTHPLLLKNTREEPLEPLPKTEAVAHVVEAS